MWQIARARQQTLYDVTQITLPADLNT
jgi:hypothetical protein